MFDSRKFIGMNFELAKQLLEEEGFCVVEKENTEDDKHAFDSKLVVRVDVDGKQATLVTAKFLLKI